MTGIDLALGSGGSISGTVRGDFGGAMELQPLAFSQVYAVRDGQTIDDAWFYSLAVGLTDFAGNFTIDGLAPGNYHVVALGQADFAGEY